MTQDTRRKRSGACGGLGAALAVLAVVGAWAPGCSLPRRAEFEDDALLLGLDGSYELNVHDLGDPADYTLRVEGESVSASLGHAEGWFGPRGALFVDAVAEGVSVVELRLRGRVLDRLTVEVAAVDRVRAELVIEPNVAYLAEPFGVLRGDGVILRVGGEDASGRVFDQLLAEVTQADSDMSIRSVWDELHEFTADSAGIHQVMFRVGSARVRTLSIPVLDPADIRAVHIELASDRLIWVAGTTSEGLQVVLLDADVEVDGESRPPVGLAVYNVGVDSPPGTVITATWSGLSDTYTF